MLCPIFSFLKSDIVFWNKTIVILRSQTIKPRIEDWKCSDNVCWDIQKANWNMCKACNSILVNHTPLISTIIINIKV